MYQLVFSKGVHLRQLYDSLHKSDGVSFPVKSNNPFLELVYQFNQYKSKNLPKVESQHTIHNVLGAWYMDVSRSDNA